MRIQKIQFSNQEGKAGYVSYINKIEDSVKGVLGVPLQEAVAQFRPLAGEVSDFFPFVRLKIPQQLAVCLHGYPARPQTPEIVRNPVRFPVT
jgi:hypothetical protein